MSEQESVSSPIATGGAGPFFEQHVDALFLALLLVRGIPPVLRDCQVEEVHVQTGHLGWKTDDLLVVGTRGAGGNRRLAAQVKRQFTISATDKECKKAFSDFWSEFKSNDKFDPEKDRLALVTLRGTDTLLNAFNNLLDCARASADGADFARRLAPEGYLSKPARGHATAIRAIIERSEAGSPSDDDFWRFLKVLHVVSLDLNTSTAQNEAWIKTLLAVTSQEPDPLAAAEATWRELLEIAGSSMPTAASFTQTALPGGLRQRHAAAAAGNGGALQALAAHGETTLNGIRTTIAHSAQIRRDALVTRVLEFLEESQVVVVTGPAGLGKSALAKGAIELLRADYFCLTFRAEEFAASHIDQTLQQAQVPISAERLLALLAAQGRKVVLVESVERLLEAAVRDAFSDLLRLAQRDRSLQLVLTCRDYSLETVTTSLLDQASLRHRVLEVPPLTDVELAQVVQVIPALEAALASASLKELLRSPYLLDKAARMDWRGAGDLPRDERSFRLRCWGEVVRRDAVTRAGLPRRREQVFVELAQRRARALSPYVTCDDLDAEALEELRKDDLVAQSPETSALAAPAHDVLEDWAIIQWLGGRFSAHEGDAKPLANDIGGYPAIRRGYRRWLGEMLECEAERADAFVLSSYRDESLPAHFRDDTLVCALLSSAAQDFLTRQTETLLADEGCLLVRVIHLLRVACKAAPPWLPEGMTISSLTLVPKGNAWPAVLRAVGSAVDRLLPAKLGLLLGLLEDWVRGINALTPEPVGFRDAGKIAFEILRQLHAYQMEGPRRRVLEVVAMIPRADPAAFEDLLRRACARDRHDPAASELAEILLRGVRGGFACRAFPLQMARLAAARFCLSDADLQHLQDPYARIEVESFFGIREDGNLRLFPASAIRGPFLPLLRTHPNVAVDLVIQLLNHACAWYGEQRCPQQRLEPAWEVTLDIPGEGRTTQWANSRLWCLYRGLSVGPCVLQTALMALESWLLDISQIEGVDVEAWLLKLLRDSNNVAVTAVVASVCNAHPDKSGRAGLALLSSRELVEMDRARTVQDHGHSTFPDLLAAYDAESKIYEDERKKSGSLPHRRHDLEVLAVKLQFGPQRGAVWEILDRHRGALPPSEEQTEGHRLWRLALHRMNTRGFRPIEPEGGSADNESVPEDGSREGQRIYFELGAIEEDVQELVDRGASVWTNQVADVALLNWGIAAWKNDRSGGSDISAWRARLAEAMERDRGPHEDYSRGGPGLIAAACVRDHWEEMRQEDREWCVIKLISEIERDCDGDDDLVRQARGHILCPDRPAAYVLPRVLGERPPANADPRTRAAVVKALTHSSSEVVAYAAEGVGRYLQGEWLSFAQQCVAAMARQARLISQLLAAEATRPFNERLTGSELVRSVTPDVRACIERGDLDAQSELARLDLVGWPGRIAARTILQILGHSSQSTLATQFHRRVVAALVCCWNAARRDREKREPRNHEFEHECSRRVAYFVLKLRASEGLATCEPLLAAVDDHPREVAQFVEDLIFAEDGSGEETPFWEIWQAFAERLCEAPWIVNVDSRHATGAELLSRVFLLMRWKQDVRHWRRLDGQAGRIDALVADLPASAGALRAYCRFLFDIGEQSLPNGFVVVAERLTAGNPGEMLAEEDTVFVLESLLRPYVHGEPLRLKSNPRVRTAVLQILDQLVEVGSSAAFQMRDDLVTPVGTRS